MAGSSMIARISLLLAINHVFALAQLVNTTLYSTHPQVTYAPESCCVKDIFGGCMKRYDPFTMSTYVDPNSVKRTFFQTSSWGNEPDSPIMKRRVEISFYGRAVYVYGPPRARLDNRPGHIQVSLDKRLITTVDLEATYRGESEETWGPQLIYHWEGGTGDAARTLEISLLDAASGPIQGFGLDSVVFTSMEPLRPPKYKLSESEKIKEVAIHDTNFVTTFTPSYAWEKNTSASASGGIRTFHATSNELAAKSENIPVMPVAEFTAQCAALVVYGASPAQLEGTFPKGFRHGHLQVCQGKNCEYIDMHQAYLHIPEHFWNESVLLYSTDRMSPKLIETVTMRLLDSPSPVGHLWTMSFSHAVCSQVVPKWPWTHPIPDGHYSTHLVPFTELSYAPSFMFGAFSPWTWKDLYRFAPAKPYWFSGMMLEMPSWSTTVRGHDIKIFVPSPNRFPETQYANVCCCIDGECHYPDIERWLSGVRNSHSDVLLVHYEDLNPFRGHRISVTAVRRNDEVGDKIIAVSRVEYQQVVVLPRPSPTPPSPSKPEKSSQIPTPTKPVHHRDGDVSAIELAAWALVIFMALGCSFALCLIVDGNQRQPEREPLISHSPPARGSPASPVIRRDDISPNLKTRQPMPNLPGRKAQRQSASTSANSPIIPYSDCSAPPTHISPMNKAKDGSFPEPHDPITPPAPPPRPKRVHWKDAE